MNIKPSKKYGISPNVVEDKALNSERFRTPFNTHRLDRTSKLSVRMDRFDKKSTPIKSEN